MFVRNKWMVTLLVALLVVTLITGCGSKSASKTPESGEKILTIAAITDPAPEMSSLLPRNTSYPLISMIVWLRL